VEARPEYVLVIPGDGWSPFVAAVFTAAFFLLLTGKFVFLAAACGLVAIGAIIVWAWGNDPGPSGPCDIGGGIELPVNITGRNSHAWMAAITLNTVLFNMFISVMFAYLFLWTSRPDWLSAAGTLPDVAGALISAALLLGGGGAGGLARRMLSRNRFIAALLLLVSGVLVASGCGYAILEQWNAGLRPDDHSYGAVVFTLLALAAVLSVAVLIMCLFCILRLAANLIDTERRLTFEVTTLMCSYTVFQSVATVAMIYLLPRILTGAA
jgi:cytochrome c oxidase subunit I+III